MPVEIANQQEFRAVRFELEITINCPITKVWNSLVSETTKWWPKDFYTSPNTKAFIIEPKLGGRMYEKGSRAGAGLVWMTVYGVEPPKYLYLVGFISPPFGGPATSLLTINLSENGKNTTLLKIQDNCFGQLSGDMSKSLADGWQLLFEGNLKPFAEKKR